ncbi:MULTISPECIES: ribonuclease H-like domain-containing protein [unclassified Parvimonas]|uniref:ribonuclease H-like domain-containing protein n=1 Tax=unclassified Parvimonas TaxID=1151464 RepID=UPI002B48E8E4|nr:MULTISPECIES: ribonuclease H-like domain-containing protein [unclassified Parvimonas]MEB3024920.1 ribonuclease H-like domain-containing protein [Parvimonas sp. M13]MEB3088935.1 ribonuclease H-like domain-containing protein [Parvimonas sp. M20]
MKKVINIEKTDSNFEDYILFDIETTGLSRTKDFMYMFGICEKKEKELIYSQYYIENEREEKDLILKIKELLNSKQVISYNGDRFDFPFIRKKMEKYNITKIDFQNIDIYRQFQKLNFFLDEPSLKAINLGKRLGFDVHNHVNQQEMPKIFKMYQELKDKEMLSKLIYHNYIDLQILSYIYEYKESVLNKILTINNKKFTGILKNIYIQKNYLITRLYNTEKAEINFHQNNYSITSNKDELKIALELEDGLIENNIKAKVFKSKYENKIFKESQNLTENFILIIKNNKIIKENLLLLLNLI